MKSPDLKSHALTAALLLCAPFAHAQQATAPTETATYVPGGRIPQLQGEIAIDGKLDDAAWQNALVQEIAYDIQPGDNTPAPVRTTVRIGYTADAIYFAFHAMDSDPSAIRAHLRDRDAAFNDDWVGVFMDTFNDNRRGYELIVNPLGVQADLLRDEANTNNQEDPSWDGLWESAGQLTAEGYDVEIRVPFSTLRFPRGGGDQKWGLSLFRNYPRDKRHQLTSHKVPRDSNCFQCEWGKYEGMAGAQQGRNLEVVPFLTMGKPQYRDAAGESWKSGDSSIEPGVDVSWAPSPAMTLNATLNPDFSQVETDQLQLDINNSFALFYQEKRPFFLEGADYFTSQFDVLYTRQIADPDFGARITGRTGSGAYGAFVARDASTLVLVPGVQGSGFEQLDQKANVAVGRYRHDFNTHFSVGAIGTFREGDAYSNNVAGLDARWQQGAHTATAQFLHSQSEYPDDIVAAYAGELGNDATPSGNAWRTEYNFSNRNWGFNLQHEDIDPGFRADLGFIGMVGYDKSLVGGEHSWYRDGAAFNKINVYADWDITHRYDGQLLEREFEAQVSVQGPMQSNVRLHGMTRVAYWNGRLFDEHYADINANFRPNGSLQLGAYLQAGTMIDRGADKTGRRTMLEVSGNANIGRGLALDWDIIRQQMKRDGGTAFTATVVNTGGSWQFDPHQRLRLTLQGSEVERNQALYVGTVNETARDWAAQVVYSYKINPRTALYAGASYGAFMDDDNPDLFGNTRSVFLKLSYGWQP
ncbi:carbohydrate binding family 9 domain-containing protein [Thermomonas sp. HDW16]|uniref:carbohydrate binding family 9 domain-containing protein n=1 Tax=Thermomonas sp. HDW16 TaxID=2714945 RepID=UPI00140D9BED|nr:carbohydrate binding family 9 domain-containing protein [Thermomonas sp. HDW16]QIL19265.1 carbohydrate binding family 9 domain-containing protein [Thermomonas sp. HDW16]